ncbi:MAG: hypothetical protein R3Y62_00615, partial [Eubacteriales bacterium]
TPPFHGGIMGSIPVRVTKNNPHPSGCGLFFCSIPIWESKFNQNEHASGVFSLPGFPYGSPKKALYKNWKTHCRGRVLLCPRNLKISTILYFLKTGRQAVRAKRYWHSQCFQKIHGFGSPEGR